MAMTRQQHKAHLIDNQKIDVYYDRFTTRFSLAVNEQRVYSRLLLLSPWRKQQIMINNIPYNLTIGWFVLWRSSLTPDQSSPQHPSITELLPQRRRKSIMIAIYAGLISAIKLTLVILSYSNVI
ncbi:hypothetical protein [Shewanella frigidimarina]|uniref:Uncharacterized protein n=1 Tax=Shewanella frigidimarina TaxID=56812 RepID=A0A106BYV3_SHEFR|nr:hypothetical protein [Shewanella frigidimarina]KVX01139.1 hypothetical protein AWJ07_06715 [Shewanella frigidimarina]